MHVIKNSDKFVHMIEKEKEKKKKREKHGKPPEAPICNFHKCTLWLRSSLVLWLKARIKAPCMLSDVTYGRGRLPGMSLY